MMKSVWRVIVFLLLRPRPCSQKTIIQLIPENAVVTYEVNQLA